MENKELHFLTEVSDVLAQKVDTSKLAENLKNIITKYTPLKNLSIYVFDTTTGTLRDCKNNWQVMEDAPEIYNAYKDIENHDFVINSKAYKLPPVIGEITFKINSLFMPVVKDENIFGITELVFENDTQINMEFLFLMKILAGQIS